MTAIVLFYPTSSLFVFTHILTLKPHSQESGWLSDVLYTCDRLQHFNLPHITGFVAVHLQVNTISHNLKPDVDSQKLFSLMDGELQYLLMVTFKHLIIPVF